MSNSHSILLIEDEPKLAQVIIDYLQAEGFITLWLKDGEDAIVLIRTHNPALVILDIMLPGINGFEICKSIRKFSQVPLVMLTARSHEQDRVLGFELGADDYICKPFSPRELVWRVKAILKRVDGVDSAAATHNAVLEFDFAAYEAKLNGRALDLTAIEFGILSTLAEHPGRVFSRNDLLNRIYSDHRVINDRTIDSHIKNIRRKIKLVEENSDIVQSIYGLGYKVDFK